MQHISTHETETIEKCACINKNVNIYYIHFLHYLHAHTHIYIHYITTHTYTHIYIYIQLYIIYIIIYMWFSSSAFPDVRLLVSWSNRSQLCSPPLLGCLYQYGAGFLICWNPKPRCTCALSACINNLHTTCLLHPFTSNFCSTV